jgi:hypothetical protein
LGEIGFLISAIGAFLLVVEAARPASEGGRYVARFLVPS